MMRKILEFSWFSNTCRLKLRTLQGDGEVVPSIYIYIYMFMASNIAMSCITCVTLNWIGCLVILLMEEILHQLISSFSHYLQGFIPPRWLFGISINRFFGHCTWEITSLVTSV